MKTTVESVFDDQMDTEVPIRKVELKDGQVITMKRDSAYGLITISFKNGRVPLALSGQYTSFSEADKAVTIYVNQKGLEKEAA